MIAKLIKHEYRATARTFLPLLGAVLVLSGLSWLMMQLGGGAAGASGSNSFFDALHALVTMFTLLGLVALMLCSVLITVQRFYKNILGDEGYLMLTLPATPAQHIAAKLIVGTAWTVAALAMTLLVAWMLGSAMAGTATMHVSVDGVGATSLTLSQAAASFKNTFGIPLWRGALMIGLLFLCGVVNTYLMAYFCMTVGSQWPQQRLAASIGVFVVVDFVRRFLFVCILAVVSVSVAAPGSALYQALTGLTVGSVFMLVPAVGSAVLLAEAVVYFFAARWFLTARLNLA